MPTESTLAERITWLRLALGLPRREALSLSKFAELVGRERGADAEGYSPSAALRWEEGSTPDADALNAMVALANRHGLTWVTWRSLYEGLDWPEMPPRIIDDPPAASPAKGDRGKRRKLSDADYAKRKKGA